MVTYKLSILQLVESRCRNLRVSRGDSPVVADFKTSIKGIRRIEQVFSGDLGSPYANMILVSLPMALDLPKEIIDSYVRETADVLENEKRRIADEKNAKLRASFKPNAYLIGTTNIPSQIDLRSGWRV